MATCRPTVTVYSVEKQGCVEHNTKMPAVFAAPIRPDLVQYIHQNVSRNKRQADGVNEDAGYQTSAVSWGTGRAVSRIPRVPGGGTHRAGQAAFGNMCRGGGMFSPNKAWRRWHRHVNLRERRHAIVSAIATCGVPALVASRGHRIDNIPELPLVVSDNIQKTEKTKDAVQTLIKLGCGEELEKVIKSKKIRTGRGKSRNRRYVQRKGPLIVYHEDNGLTRAFRGVPGVDLCKVSALNLMKLAPGGVGGRLIIWSESAFKHLNQLYGSVQGSATSTLKKGYHLPRPMMTNADLARLINSDEIQTVAKPQLRGTPRATRKLNPLRNKHAMYFLNPIAAHKSHLATLAQTKGTDKHTAVQLRKSKLKKEKVAHRSKGRQFIKDFKAAFHLKPSSTTTEGEENN